MDDQSASKPALRLSKVLARVPNCSKNLPSTLRRAQGSGQARIPFVMFYPCGVGKPSLSLLMRVFIVDSKVTLLPIDFHLIDYMEDFQILSWKYLAIDNDD
jgi:hypothetical protein